MGIKRGNALKEHASAVITETRFNRAELQDTCLLLLEGPDDIDVISDFYLHDSRAISYRLLKANDIEEDYKVAGKKHALALYENLKSNDRNVICLLDRDYDVYLNEKHDDINIKYYHYYELENYLFEEDILKIIVKNIYNYSDIDEYEKIKKYLSDIELACIPYIVICLFREINYRNNFINQEQLEGLLKIIKCKPSSMMQMKNLETDNKLERIERYIVKELQQLELDLEQIKSIVNSYGFNIELIFNNSVPLYQFKYNLKGKIIASCLEIFVKYIFEVNPELESKRSKGSLKDLITRLKLEWIPKSSKELKGLLEEIEEQFQTF